MSPNRIPLAFAVQSNIFVVSASFYRAESENIGGRFFDPVYPVFWGPTSGGRKSAVFYTVYGSVLHETLYLIIKYFSNELIN